VPLRIPSNKVIGLQRIPRIVDVFSAGCGAERPTNQIAGTIRHRQASGVAVSWATHLCMSMRGVEAELVRDERDAGCVRDQVRTRMEFTGDQLRAARQPSRVSRDQPRCMGED
jgi:GTP cyclohydrolase I